LVSTTTKGGGKGKGGGGELQERLKESRWFGKKILAHTCLRMEKSIYRNKRIDLLILYNLEKGGEKKRGMGEDAELGSQDA